MEGGGEKEGSTVNENGENYIICIYECQNELHHYVKL